MRAFIDRNFDKLISRKLFVWFVSTCFLFAGKLDGDQWIAVSLAYIGSQGIADIATAWKSGHLLTGKTKVE
jgi:hypothetical protein